MEREEMREKQKAYKGLTNVGNMEIKKEEQGIFKELKFTKVQRNICFFLGWFLNVLVNN